MTNKSVRNLTNLLNYEQIKIETYSFPPKRLRSIYERAGQLGYITARERDRAIERLRVRSYGIAETWRWVLRNLNWIH